MSPRRLGRWRLIFLSGSALFAAGATGGAVILASGENTELALETLRNAFGFTGISLISAQILGGPLSWAPLLGWVVIPAYVFPNVPADSIGVATFYAQPAENLMATMTAYGLLVVGLAISGYRDSAGGLRLVS